jgi:pimeloyl-ACP methyl ester carboxylesterase
VAQVSQPRFLEMIAPPDEERAFWAAYVNELFSARLTKDDLLSTLHCMLDFAENMPIATHDPADWGERILIIESEDDATFDAQARACLKALYPKAAVHTFRGGGHSPATTRRAEFFQVVRQFLGRAER